jgi:DNA-binding SARP family transcriptional activator
VTRIAAFGRLTAWADGSPDPVDLGGPRQRAVLGLLVAAGSRVVSTDRFLDELYDGEPPPRALASLQSFVSHLRRRLEPTRALRAPATVLASATPGYRLQLGAEDVDVWHFEELARRALAEPDPAAALDLADRGLARWTDVPFADHPTAGWARTAAASLEALRTALVTARAEAALQLGDSGAVARDLAAHVAAHPLDEGATRLLALALYREHRQAEALDVLARSRRTLADELGVDPAPALRELEAGILGQDRSLLLGAAPPAAAPAPVDVRAAAPRRAPDDGLVGRDPELARLHRATAEPGVVWVEGEAGIGKSALVDRFCDETAPRAVVARGRCPEVDGAPVAWAWWDVLTELGEQPPTAAVAAFDVAETVEAALVRAGHRGRVVVALDDLHRADDETLQVLRHLLGRQLGISLVATFRGDEVTPSLGTTLAALAGATRDRIALTGLDPADARRLLERAAGGSTSAGDRAGLLPRAGGNPLFLRELGVALAHGSVTADAGTPPAVQDLIARRLDRLPAPVRAVLQTAALLGRDVDVDLLVDLAARAGAAGEEEVLDALDAAYVAGVLEQRGPGELRFTHVLVRETCYSGIPPLRRRRLHQLAWEAVAASAAPAPLQLAHHAGAGLDARTAARAGASLLAAGRDLHRAGNSLEAARALEAGITALQGRPHEEDLHAAHRALVAAWARAGRWDRARAAREVAVAAARADDDGSPAAAERVAAAWVTDAPALTTPRTSALDNAAELAGIRAALDVDTDRRTRVRLLVALVHEGELLEPEAMVPVADEAVRLAREDGDHDGECLALNARALLVNADPVGADLGALGHRMLALGAEHRSLLYRGLAHFHLHVDAVVRGDLPAAAAHIEQALAIGHAGQLGPLVANARAFAGTRAVVAGDVEAAAVAYREATTEITAEGGPNDRAIDLFVRCATALAAGSVAPLLPDLQAASAVSPAWMWRDLLVCALLDAGQVTRAREHYAAVPYPRNATWQVATAVQVLNAVRLDDRARVAELHRQLLPFAGRLLCTANGALVVGPADLALAGCAAVLGDEAAVETHQAAAAELAARVGAPHWAAEARADLVARLG